MMVGAEKSDNNYVIAMHSLWMLLKMIFNIFIGKYIISKM